MTLNAKIRVLWIFWWFRAARYISRMSCVETNWDRHRKAAYEIVIIECRLQRSKSRFSRLKKPVHEGIKVRSLSKSYYFIVVGQSFVKMVQIGMGMLPITTTTQSQAFQSYQHRWLWKTLNFRNKRFLLIFAIFGCSTHSKNKLRWNGWR